jgi:ABC-type Fe3+-siderophore transport system permease subunit
MVLQAPLARPSFFAISVGAVLVVALALLRARTQAIADTWPLAAAALSALVFVIPGIVTGAIGARAAFLNGVVLGLVAAAVVTFQSAQFRQPNWSSILVYETVGVWACIGVPLCVLGAAIGRLLARRRL